MMINDLRNEIINIVKREKSYVPTIVVEKIVIYIIYLKYLCEIGKVEYEKAIYNNEIYDIISLPTYIKNVVLKQAIAINSLLRNYTGIKARDILLELIDYSDGNVNFYNIDEEKLFYAFKMVLDYSEKDYSIYDKRGKTTYIYEKEIGSYEYFVLFDEILGIHNKYKKIDEINYNDYENLYIYYNAPKYIRSDSELFEYIFNTTHLVKKVVLYSKYSKISDFKNGRLAAHFIKTIIIKGDNIVVIFELDSKEMSIINGNNPQITDYMVLDTIVKENKEKKDLLVKIDYDELRKNGMRLGFNLYQMKKKSNGFDINKIVDENTEYLKNLNRLNEVVEQEINKLFNL